MKRKLQLNEVYEKGVLNRDPKRAQFVITLNLRDATGRIDETFEREITGYSAGELFEELKKHLRGEEDESV